jgi:pimeloyl-ACP methyl ester carboxylesterase
VYGDALGVLEGEVLRRSMNCAAERLAEQGLYISQAAAAVHGSVQLRHRVTQQVCFCNLRPAICTCLQRYFHRRITEKRYEELNQVDMNERREIAVNGVTLSVFESGTGPLVILCHGWPETAYSWRHQLSVLVQAGYRVVVPDMRGYGGSSVPHEVHAYTITHLVGDMVGLVDALGETRACIIGHDWGANVAWASALMRPDIFVAMAALSVPHRPRNAELPPMAALIAAGMRNFYWFYFSQEGVAEAELERDIESTIRRVFFSLSGDMPDGHGFDLAISEGRGFLDLTIDPEQMPGWLSAEDLAVYIACFRRTGMRGPLNWYRNYDRNWEIMAPFQGAKVTPPTLFIAGARDVVIATPIGRNALEALEASVPNLRDRVLIPGAGHWVQQEKPNEVNEALLKFLAEDYPA